MSTIVISRESVEGAQNAIIQFLRDSGYEGSLEDGTGLHDIVIKPGSLLYGIFANLALKAAAYQSLQRAGELKSVIGDEEYDAAVDCVLSNWFVSRNDGKPSRGTMRIWFLKPMEFLHFKDGERIGLVDTLDVVADGEQVFVEKDFSCIYNTANNTDEYYVDVVVRTAGFSDQAPDETTAPVSAYINDIYFLRATVPGAFTPGVLVESSEDFIRRTEKAITTRELITDRAIHTVLRDEFEEIIRLYVARHGSGEQLRDIKTFQNVVVHVGNKADIYIASDLLKQSVEVNLGPNGEVDTQSLPHSVSVVGYVCAEVDGEQADLAMTCVEETWCSNGMLPSSLRVVQHRGQGRALITLLAATPLREIHEFVYSETQRVACYDPMVKHMFPLLLYPTLNVELHDATIASARDIKRSVCSYVKDIVQSGMPWIASNLVTAVHNEVPNVRKIHLPIPCTGVLYDPLTCEFLEIDVGNKFSVSDHLDAAHSKQITSNTVQFYTDDSMIFVQQV